MTRSHLRRSAVGAAVVVMTGTGCGTTTPPPTSPSAVSTASAMSSTVPDTPSAGMADLTFAGAVTGHYKGPAECGGAVRRGAVTVTAATPPGVLFQGEAVQQFLLILYPKGTQ